MKRIIDKETELFLRDDDMFNVETEQSIEAPTVSKFYKAKWNGEEWEEGATQEYIDSLKSQAETQEPSLEERIQALEVMELERILGGGF